MEKKVEFYSEGCLIRGMIYTPDNTNEDKKSPVVILCHGFAGIKELFLPNFAKEFSKNGFLAFTFDYRGFGESEGEEGRIVPEFQVRDIRNAISFIKTVSEADSSKISLWGTSYGGVNAIIAASREPEIKCLVIQGTFGNGERVITRGMNRNDKDKLLASLEKMSQKLVLKNKGLSLPLYKILSDSQSVEFYNLYIDKFPQLKIKIPFLTTKETLELKPDKIIGKLNLPISITAAENDIVNPLEESKILYDTANEPKELNVINGAKHYDLYIGEYFKEVVITQLKWLKKYGI